MAMPTPTEIGQSYSRGVQNGVEKYKKGVQRVTVNPQEKAAQNLDKAKRNFANAVDSGRMAAGLRRGSLQSWQQATVTKGGQRIAAGAQEAVPKVVAYYSAVGGQIQQLIDQINAMPNDTDADAEQRMLAWSRGMRAIKAGRNQAY